MGYLSDLESPTDKTGGLVISSQEETYTSPESTQDPK